MPPSVRTGLRTVALRTSFKMPVSVETILETPSLETPAFRVYRPVYLALFTRLRLLQHLLRGYCYGFKKGASQNSENKARLAGNSPVVTRT